MTARRTAALAAYWTAVLLAAATATTVLPLPFTGPLAVVVGVNACVAVCLIGYAHSPARKDRP